ncbi:ubiquitin-like protein [Plasmodium brasilianum]|uniref:Ubiquitin-like protein n=1 Tax=Plasmodium brasilianum TaxID=5824 RepID=A0ACB9YEI1_PLABR|nr:ubiquitin-like protein [Plasmodium brasilianum]
MYVTVGTNDILITINDFVNKNSSTYQLTDISNSIKINELINKIKLLKNYTYENSSLVLYFARVECKLDEKLSTYNKSNRKTIKLELYLSSLITVNVRTLQSCGSGTSRCIPLWSACFRQTIKIKIVDTSEVRVLKQKIYNLTDESVSIPVENIVLLYKGAPLNNFLTLKESELVDNCRIDYFVPICYIYKEKKENDEDDSDECEENKARNELQDMTGKKINAEKTINMEQKEINNDAVKGSEKKEVGNEKLESTEK